jgi:hypothetical protein
VTRASGRYSTGDVVAYQVEGSQARVIHRIVDGTAEGFATQGDNRTSTDPWTPSSADITGHAVVRVPQLGTLVVSLSRPPFAMAATGFAAFLTTIWPEVRPRANRAKSTCCWRVVRDPREVGRSSPTSPL